MKTTLPHKQEKSGKSPSFCVFGGGEGLGAVQIWTLRFCKLSKHYLNNF